jgi:hypothetical protein
MESEHPFAEQSAPGVGFELVIEGVMQGEIENGFDIPPGEAGDLGDEITLSGWGG